MTKQQIKDRGFTIIEVVLVLAIAALIFLMVFIALPALQASQRDTARKNDVSIVSAAVNSFSSANQGSLPTTSQSSRLQNYVSGLSGNTTLSNVTVVGYSASVSVADGEIKVVAGATCGDAGVNGANQTLKKGTKRQYATFTRLEGGKSTYCLSA